MSEATMIRRVALVGFGEAGSILGEDLAQQGCEVAAYDILLDSEHTRAALLAKAERAGVRAVRSLRELVTGAAAAASAVETEASACAPQRPQLVISAVTATSSATVACEAAALLARGQIFFDINSCSPATKRGNAQAVCASGADYVEAAVMAPVPPQRLAVPMLLGGARARDIAVALRALGLNTTPIAEEIGIASAVKMCRSIVIKGIEALATESMLAARRFGAEDSVLASLNATFPGMGWTGALPDYLVSRAAEHGRRRAAEMREVASTLRAIGLEPIMATATAERQDRLVDEMAARGVNYPHGQTFSWRALADELANKA